MKPISYLQRFGNIELAVRKHGQGMPLVWGHNLLGSMRVDDQAGIWDWEELEEHCMLARYDARGHGNSDGSYAAKDYRWSTLGNDMLRVADSVTSTDGSYILGGASMGCCAALEAALKAPDKVAGLILALPPTAWRSRPMQAVRYKRQAWLSGAFGATPYRVLDYLPDARQHVDARRRLSNTVARGLATANPLYVQAALEGAVKSDLPKKRLLRKLDVPTLIFSWNGDATHPLSTAKILADTLPNVQSLVISDANDVSDWTATACNFIDQVSKSRKHRAARRAGKGNSANAKP
ncbi:MAG: alpha/beta hydrolase [Halioglobus sp.]